MTNEGHTAIVGVQYIKKYHMKKSHKIYIGTMVACIVMVGIPLLSAHATRLVTQIETTAQKPVVQTEGLDMQEIITSVCDEENRVEEARIIMNHPRIHPNRPIAGLMRGYLSTGELRPYGSLRYGNKYIVNQSVSVATTSDEECSNRKHISFHFAYEGFWGESTPAEVRVILYGYTDEGNIYQLSGWKTGPEFQINVVDEQNVRSTFGSVATSYTEEGIEGINIIHLTYENGRDIDELRILLNKKDRANRFGYFQFLEGEDGTYSCRELYKKRFGNNKVELKEDQCTRVHDNETNQVTFSFPFSVMPGVVSPEENIVSHIWYEHDHNEYRQGWKHEKDDTFSINVFTEPVPEPEPEPVSSTQPDITVVVVENNLPTPVERVETYGAFVSGGVDVEFTQGASLEGARVLLNGSEVHALVTYDGNHAATSLFNLVPDTTYNVSVELASGQSIDTTLTTRPEWSIEGQQEQTQREVLVSTNNEFQQALENVQPGDNIKLGTGVYEGFEMFQKTGAYGQRIIIESQDKENPAQIVGDIILYQSSYYTFYGLDIVGTMNVRGSHHTEIVENNIHDSESMGQEDWFVFIQHNDDIVGEVKDNYNLILKNRIHDDVHGEFVPVDQGENQTYYGIKQDFGVGGYTVIADNVLFGMAAAIAPGGDEGHSPVSEPSDLDVKSVWANRELDIYDNVIDGVSDDCIELDGHGINVRVFKNYCKESTNGISTAQVFPGPIFIAYNQLHGFNEGALKMNTGVAGVTRNVYIYHNTIKQEEGASYALYRGFPARTQNVVLRNNIIEATGRVIETDIGSNFSCEYYHKNHSFDYDVLWSPLPEGEILFKWGYTDWGDNRRYTSFDAFQRQTANPNYVSEGEIFPNTPVAFNCQDQEVIGQEPNGVFADPSLAVHVGEKNGETVEILIPAVGSVAVDRAVPLPGINDQYLGAGPDVGAVEAR